MLDQPSERTIALGPENCLAASNDLSPVRAISVRNSMKRAEPCRDNSSTVRITAELDLRMVVSPRRNRRSLSSELLVMIRPRLLIMLYDQSS
ncbi:hypothetical protein AAFG07_05045 [Bradyrhizobium sp. B097]|uniref:hypothetical protein n=1 Tax=Bradyrhizobium sp. B097 TaxID=3140244 RepID=UPI0031838404